MQRRLHILTFIVALLWALAASADPYTTEASTGGGTVEREVLPGSPAPQVPAPLKPAPKSTLRLWVAAGIGALPPLKASQKAPKRDPAILHRGFQVEE